MSNNPSGVNKIEINADDGYGFRQINFNQQIGVSYTSLKKEGLHDIIFKLTLNTGETLQSRIIIKFGDPQKQGLQNPPIGKQAEILNADRFHFIESEEAYDGKKASAILSINYAAGREEIRRPLIVSEGYDPGIITTPENVFGEGDIDKFITEIRDTDNDLNTLLTVDNTQEYDIIYVDWVNGVDDMRRNAKLLKTIIAWVNNEKSTNGSTEENVVIGQSMGGLIARHALREMEIENKDHETRLYVSHDSPHQGANVPYGLQYMARHARNEYVRAPLLMGAAEVLVPTILTGAAWFSQIQLRDLVLGFDDAPPSSYPSPYAALTLADMPASRQLLRNFVKQDYTRDNTAQINWQNELEAMGYPREFGIRNVAISNGSECGIPQELDPGDYLFRFYGKSSRGFFNGLIRIITDPLVGIAINNPDLFLTSILFGSSKYNYDIWAKTIPTGSNQQVYKGRIVYTKKLLFLFPIDVVLMNKNLNAPSGSLPIDTYAGGFYNVKAQIDKDNLPSFIGDRITHLENFNFIPVSSALDVGEGNVNLDENDFTASYSAGSPPSAPKNIPFDNFIAAFNTNVSINPNQAHISFEVRNANWLAEELNGATPNIADCSFVCSTLDITGSDSLCSTNIYTVPNYNNVTYNWTIIPSTGITMSNSNTNQISISANSQAVGEYSVRVEIDNPDCGSTTLTKTILVGKPKYSISPLDSNAPSTEAWAYINGDGVSLSFQGISHPTFSVVSSSGTSTIYILGPYSSGNEYKIRANGSNNTWSKTIDVHIQNSCGTITKRVFLVPPPPSGGCNYTLQSTGINTYSLLPPPDCLSSFQTMTSNESSVMMNSEIASPNIFSIKVYNMNGALQLETNEQSISLESFKNGFYIIKATWNGNETTKKVAKS